MAHRAHGDKNNLVKVPMKQRAVAMSSDILARNTILSTLRTSMLTKFEAFPFHTMHRRCLPGHHRLVFVKPPCSRCDISSKFKVQSSKNKFIIHHSSFLKIFLTSTTENLFILILRKVADKVLKNHYISLSKMPQINMKNTYKK